MGRGALRAFLRMDSRNQVPISLHSLEGCSGFVLRKEECCAIYAAFISHGLHVDIGYILGPQSNYMATPLGPRYILYRYMEPLGLAGKPCRTLNPKPLKPQFQRTLQVEPSQRATPFLYSPSSHKSCLLKYRSFYIVEVLLEWVPK